MTAYNIGKDQLGMSAATQTPTSKTIYVTRTGLPLSFELEWPFRHATSGADFDVLHTVVTLENSEGLRALVAGKFFSPPAEKVPFPGPQNTERARPKFLLQGGGAQ